MNGLRFELEQVIQKHHLLGHSFYQRWQAGQLEKTELQGYSKEYYSFENEFSRFVSAIHSRCEDLPMRQQLLENLIHEEQGEDNHPALWKKFAEGLGVSETELEQHFHSDATQHLLKTYRDLCQNGTVEEGLAALYAYERQQPDVARQKIDGLKRFYNINEASTLAFFQVHQTTDVYHSETEAALLERICQDEASQKRAVAAAEKALLALNEFLTGVERRYRPEAA